MRWFCFDWHRFNKTNNYNYLKLFLVSTAAVNDNSTRGDCPDGWLDASFVDLGCLLFQHEDRSWWDNLMNCREKNSYLLEVFTEPQLDFIRLELQVNHQFKREINKIV